MFDTLAILADSLSTSSFERPARYVYRRAGALTTLDATFGSYSSSNVIGLWPSASTLQVLRLGNCTLEESPPPFPELQLLCLSDVQFGEDGRDQQSDLLVPWLQTMPRLAELTLKGQENMRLSLFMPSLRLTFVLAKFIITTYPGCIACWIAILPLATEHLELHEIAPADEDDRARIDAYVKDASRDVFHAPPVARAHVKDGKRLATLTVTLEVRDPARWGPRLVHTAVRDGDIHPDHLEPITLLTLDENILHVLFPCRRQHAWNSLECFPRLQQVGLHVGHFSGIMASTVFVQKLQELVRFRTERDRSQVDILLDTVVITGHRSSLQSIRWFTTSAGVAQRVIAEDDDPEE
jgi:hypothetical protein